MSGQSLGTEESRPLVSLPSDPVAYVAILGALVSAAIHLWLAPTLMGFSQTLGILFYLNGLGWIGGLLLFVSRYWRRELYLVAAGYAAVTIIAFFVMSGRLRPMAVLAKLAEAVVVLTVV